MTAAEPDWAALRGRFPALARGTYLDTASAGPTSTDAAAAAAQYYRWSGELGDAASALWSVEVEACRDAVAALVGAAPTEIGFVPNTSTAINVAALLLDGRGAVLTARGEHPSVVIPWHARRYRVDFADPEPDGRFTPGCYERALRPDTCAICVSHVRFNDGQVNDLAGIGALARARGVHLIVDAIQSVGILPVDVACGADLIGFAGFKWLNAGHGSGAMFVRAGLIERYGLPLAGRRSRTTEALSEIERLDPLAEARAFELGAMAVPGVMALGASLCLIEQVGRQNILARVTGLTGELRRGLQALGLATATDTATDIVTPILSVHMADADALVERLGARGVTAAARGDGLRLAVSWYNDEADIAACLTALADCDQSGRRA